jgi:hypothetical protein
MTVELHYDAIEALFADPAGPVGRIIEKKTLEVEAMAKALLLVPGSGRAYMPGVLAFVHGGKFYTNWSTGGRAAAHVASAPGEPPASDTGTLLASVTHAIGVEDGVVTGRVGTSKLYGKYLEEGTMWHDAAPGPHILPRPWLVPALRIVVPE